MEIIANNQGSLQPGVDLHDARDLVQAIEPRPHVAFTDTERLVGEAAKNQAAMNPKNTGEALEIRCCC